MKTKLTNYFIGTICVLVLALVCWIFSGNAVVAKRQGIQFHGKCTPGDHCAWKNTACIDSTCRCQSGYEHLKHNDIHFCEEPIQLRNIATIEDHPSLIRNQTCLNSKTKSPNSCRASPCFTGFLIDLICKIDHEIKNLDNCTITVIKLANKSSSVRTARILKLLKQNKTDLILTPFNFLRNPNPYKKVMLDSAPFVWNAEKSVYLSLGFPLFASDAKWQMDLTINSLLEKKYIDELLTKWFHKGTSTLAKEKHVTPE
ncbi:uncharacterized protein LOC118437010 [Folsomia candida]|uniref:Uncharacterized protein n=1 Tax=Folsomia candida TaxID=158441 RepID=A0A226DTI1_FOLCA|nr:uncharacterized protein LOC118437010 [Folsomia candida]OXA48509.1 hypothetical protein Fcan01_16322 [Folsomia candida]